MHSVEPTQQKARRGGTESVDHPIRTRKEPDWYPPCGSATVSFSWSLAPSCSSPPAMLFWPNSTSSLPAVCHCFDSLQHKLSDHATIVCTRPVHPVLRWQLRQLGTSQMTLLDSGTPGTRLFRALHRFGLLGTRDEEMVIPNWLPNASVSLSQNLLMMSLLIGGRSLSTMNKAEHYVGLPPSGRAKLPLDR